MKIKNFILIFLFASGVTWTYAQDNYFSLNYSTSASFGETGDYIDSYSWRGIAAEGQWLLNGRVSAGYSVSWNIFHQKLSGEFVDGTTTLTGTQLRHLNLLPILLETRYHLGDIGYGSFSPYIGLGTGIVYANQRTEIGVFAIDDSAWQFALVPTAGVAIPVSNWSMINLGFKYNYALKTSGLHANSFLNINLGIIWIQ